MSNFKPLVINSGEMQQLQPADDLDIPLEIRHQELQRKFNLLVFRLVEMGFNLPEFEVEILFASNDI